MRRRRTPDQGGPIRSAELGGSELLLRRASRLRARPDEAGIGGEGPRASEAQGLLTVVSYNLWEGRAQDELLDLAEAQSPDVLCLQEADVDALPPRLGHLRFVAATSANRLGLALYADEARFTVEAAAPATLVRSLHDRIGGSTLQRLVGARLRDDRSGRSLALGSLHAAPLTDPNVVRRRQIEDALRRLAAFGPDLPTVLAGDFNYPFRTLALRRHLELRGYALSRSPVGTYRRRGLVRGSFDLAVSRNIAPLAVETLPQRASDHLPIRIDFGYREEHAGRTERIEPAVEDRSVPERP